MFLLQRARIMRPKHSIRFKVRQRNRVWWDLENAQLPTWEINPLNVDVNELIRNRFYDEGEPQAVEIHAIHGFTDSIPSKTQQGLRNGSQPMVVRTVYNIPTPLPGSPDYALVDQAADLAIKAEIDTWIKYQRRRRLNTGRQLMDKATLISGDKGFLEDLHALINSEHYTMLVYTPASPEYYIWGADVRQRWLWRPFMGLPEQVPSEFQSPRNRANQKRKYNKRRIAQAGGGNGNV